MFWTTYSMSAFGLVFNGWLDGESWYEQEGLYLNVMATCRDEYWKWAKSKRRD